MISYLLNKNHTKQGYISADIKSQKDVFSNNGQREEILALSSKNKTCYYSTQIIKDELNVCVYVTGNSIYISLFFWGFG